MVVMAQDFKLRYPLVDGHGNFGSLDGDPAAAMRYTEARLSKYGELMLQDIDKHTVDFVPNYDDSSTEPSVLPGLFPNLLLNGSQGIAVGMSCNFLPHNAKDIYSATDLILANALKDKETPIDDIIKIIKAPDFPTGGVVYDLHEVHKAYREGHGRCMVRSKYHIEKYGRQKKDKDAIVIDEIPYGVNKSKLVLNIGKLAAESEDFIKIEHVRDESDRNGMRIVIELKKDTQTNIMINRLLKKTEMQKSLPIQCTALDNGKPKLNLNIKQLLELFLEHILEVLRNKAQYEYDKYGARLHIIEAYLKALEDTEKTISCLKTSSRNAALDNLKKIYSFDDEQATAVANMHFYSLNDEDKEKLEDEYEKDKAVYDQFGLILSDQKNLIQYARQELKDIFNKYFKKDKRRTEISTETDDRDTIPDYNVMIAYTHNGYIKSVKLDEYNVQARNGKGSAFKTKEDDFVESLHALSTRDNLVFIMSSGRAVILPAYKIPTLSKNSIGKPVENYINLHIDANNRVVNIFVLTEDDRKNGDKQLFLFTRKGYGKKMALSDLPKSTQGASIIKFDEDDSLVSACLLDKNCDIATITTKGMGGRFSSDSIMAHGRNSYGSRIMKLSKDDETVAAFAVNESDDIIMFASDGYAKRFHASKLRQVSRGFKGIKCGFDNHGKIISAVGIKDTNECMLVSKEGQLIRIPVSDFSAHGRTSNGVRAINLEEGDEIVSALVLEPENPVDDNQEDKKKEVTDNAKEEETKAAG